MNPGVTSMAPPFPAITATPFSDHGDPLLGMQHEPSPPGARVGAAPWRRQLDWAGCILAVDDLLQPVEPLVDGAQVIAVALRLLVERGPQRAEIEFTVGASSRIGGRIDGRIGGFQVQVLGFVGPRIQQRDIGVCATDRDLDLFQRRGLATLFRHDRAVMARPGGPRQFLYGAARYSAQRGAGHDRGCKRHGRQRPESEETVLETGRIIRHPFVLAWHIAGDAP